MLSKQRISFLETESFEDPQASPPDSGPKPPQSPVDPSQPNSGMRTLNFPIFFEWHRIVHADESLRYSAVLSENLGQLLNNNFFRNWFICKMLLTLSDLRDFGLARSSVLSLESLSIAQKKRIFGDESFGIGNPAGLLRWIQTALDSQSIGASDYLDQSFDRCIRLSQYFGVSLDDIGSIYKAIITYLCDMKRRVAALLAPDTPGDLWSLEMILRQLTSSALTREFFGTSSIRNDSDFFFAFELGEFYERYFSSYPEKYIDADLTFAQAQVLFAVDPQRLRPKRTWSVLVHYSNLADFRELCKSFWDENEPSFSEKMPYLARALLLRSISPEMIRFSRFSEMASRFGVKNNAQTEVLCAYVEFVYSSRLLLAENGSYELFSLVQLFTEQLTRIVSDLEKMVDFVVRISFVEKTKSTLDYADCEFFFSQIPELDQRKVALTCAKYETDPDPQGAFLADLYTNCEHRLTSNSFALKLPEMLRLCSDRRSPASFLQLIMGLREELCSIYRMPRFDPKLLALLQVTESRLTVSQNDYLDSSRFMTNFSVRAWEPDAFPFAFELPHFAQQSQNLEMLIDHLHPDKLVRVFAPNALLSPSALYLSVVRARNGDASHFRRLIHIEGELFDPLWDYMVLLVRDGFFGGFFVQVSPSDVIQGLPSRFRSQISRKPPLLGGHPGVEDSIKIVPETSTNLVEKGTGAEDYSDIDQIKFINNKGFIESHQQVFNGNATVFEPFRPWAAPFSELSGCEVYCPSSRASSSSPNLDDTSDNRIESFFRAKSKVGAKGAHGGGSQASISVFHKHLKRTLEFEYHHSVVRNSISFENFWMNPGQLDADFPELDQASLRGFLNLTRALRVPVLVSQNNQLGVDERVSSRFEYLEKNGYIVRPSVQRDGNFYEIEHFSGVVTGMRMSHHVHLQIQPSLLFTGREGALESLRSVDGEFLVVPLYNLEFRKNAFPEDLNHLFATVFSMESFFRKYISTLVGVIFIICSVIFFLTILLRKLK